MSCKGWLLSLVPSRSNASFRPRLCANAFRSFGRDALRRHSALAPFSHDFLARLRGLLVGEAFVMVHRGR